MKKLIIILFLSNLCFTQAIGQSLKTGLAAHYHLMVMQTTKVEVIIMEL